MPVKMEDLSDITVLKSIKEKGLIFFEESDADQPIIKTYFKSFIMQLGKCFFNKHGCTIFIDYVLENSESTIWRRFRPILGENFINMFVEHVLNYLEDYSLQSIIDVVEHIFYEPNDGLYENIEYPMMRDLFNSLDDSDLDTKILANFFWKDIGVNRNKFNRFVNYAEDLFNNYIYLSSTTLENMESEYGITSSELTVVLQVVLKLYVKATKDGPLNINLNYLIDKNCGITWYTKTKDNEYGYQTILFCLALHGIRVVYVPLVQKVNSWPDIRNEIEETIEKFEKNPTVQFIFGLNIDELTSHCDQIDELVDDINASLDIVSTNKIDKLYDDLKNMLLEMDKPPFCLDDIFDNMLDYYEHNVPDNPEIVELLVKIVSGNNLTTSYYTIHKAIRFTMHNMKLHGKWVVPFYTGIVNFVIKVNKLDVEDIAKKITAYALFITEDGQTLECFEKVFVESKYRTLRFIMAIMEDCHKMYDVINELYDIGKYREIGDMVLNLMYFNKLLCTLLKVKSFREHCRNKVVLLDLLNMLNIPILITNTIVNKLNKGKMDKGIYKYVRSTFECIKILGVTNFRDCSNFDIKIFDNILEKFMEVTINKRLEYDIIPVLESVDGKEEEKFKYDIPDEFLDPITYIPIDEPALLPDMDNVLGKTFVDKSSMMKSLLIKEENPFTRAKLMVEDFEKFNEDPKCKQKINQFKIKLGEWKMNNKI